MKVVLLQDVKSLGKKGQTVEVSDGYARNFILPKKLGVEANATSLNDLKLQKAHADKVAKEQLENAKQLAADLAEKTVELAVKSGVEGKIVGSGAATGVAGTAKAQLGPELVKKKIVLDEPIKSLGVHNVSIRLHKDVMATLKVHVSGK